MKFIDEKGRLFGIINLIDFLVILFLIGMMPVIFFGYKIMTQKADRPERDSYDVILKCNLIKLRPEVANLISIGDHEVYDKKYEIGKIIELGPIEPYGKDPFLKQRSATLKLRLQNEGSDLFYKDNSINSDSEFVFKTNKYDALVKVSEELTRYLNLRVTFKNLKTQEVDLIKAGDEEINAKGKIVAKIVSISSPTESLYEFELNRGNFTLGKDVDRKQITAEMVLRCKEVSNAIFFKGKVLTYDSPIEFATARYKIKGFLSKPYEVIQKQ